MSKKWILSLLMIQLVGLNGCFLAPAIDSFNQLGVTKSDRMTLLPMNVKKFQDALYWGRPSEALLYVANQNQGDIAEVLRRSKQDERIMESSMDAVNFSEDAFSADVDIVVRYLNKRIATNVIEQRMERQLWEFSVSDGWKLTAISNSKAS